MKRPLRLEICHLLDTYQTLTTKEIIQKLEKIYHHEKQIYAAENHILSLRAVGIIELLEEWVETKNNKPILIQKWGLTNYGKIKYNTYW